MENQAQILESTFEKVDSSDTPIFATAKNMDCHATATQRLAMTASNTASEKVDSSHNAPFSVIASRDSGVAIHKENTQNLESTFDKNAQKSQNAVSLEKVDSKETAQNVDKSPNEKVEIVPDKISQVAGFLMKKRGCAAFCAEIRLSVYRTSKRQAPRFFAKSQHQNQTKHKHPK